MIPNLALWEWVFSQQLSILLDSNAYFHFKMIIKISKLSSIEDRFHLLILWVTECHLDPNLMIIWWCNICGRKLKIWLENDDTGFSYTPKRILKRVITHRSIRKRSIIEGGALPSKMTNWWNTALTCLFLCVFLN